MSVVAGKRSEGDLKVITVSGELCEECTHKLL